VDALPVDLGDGGLECVEPRFVRTPVVRVLPVLEQRLEITELGAHLPRDTRELIGEPRACEALAQVVEDGLRDVDGCRSEFEGHDRKVSCES
jgi:hypothetical protein